MGSGRAKRKSPAADAAAQSLSAFIAEQAGKPQSGRARWKALPDVVLAEMEAVLKHNAAFAGPGVTMEAFCQRAKQVHGVELTRGIIQRYLMAKHGRSSWTVR